MLDFASVKHPVSSIQHLTNVEPPSGDDNFLLLLLWNLPPLDISLAFLAIILLIICSALISGSEVAFFSLNVNDLKQLKRSSDLKNKTILLLLENRKELLATILISNNFINIAIIIISSFALGEILSASELSETLVFLINVVLVTFILVLFGEIAPKVYANVNNLKLARLMSLPLKMLSKIFKKPSEILVRSTKLIEQKLAKSAENNSDISKERIGQAIEIALPNQSKLIEETTVLKNIVHFRDSTVKEIMRARVDVVSVEYHTSFHKLLSIIKTYGFSRIPVYENRVDNIKGILYIKDLIAYLDQPSTFEWQTKIRNPYVVYENAKIDDLLKAFQSEKVHLAIVRDEEYGGISGIVTLEDILEEIVGEIKDEFDGAVEIEYEQLDKHHFLFEGKTMLNDVCRIAGLDIETFDPVKNEAESIGGLILELAQEIPQKEDVFFYENFQFEIIEVNKRRVKKVKMTIQEPTNNGEN